MKHRGSITTQGDMKITEVKEWSGMWEDRFCPIINFWLGYWR